MQFISYPDGQEESYLQWDLICHLTAIPSPVEPAAYSGLWCLGLLCCLLTSLETSSEHGEFILINSSSAAPDLHRPDKG